MYNAEEHARTLSRSSTFFTAKRATDCWVQVRARDRVGSEHQQPTRFLIEVEFEALGQDRCPDETLADDDLRDHQP